MSNSQSLCQIQICIQRQKAMVQTLEEAPPVRRPLTWCSRWRFYWCDVICHMWILKLRKLNNDPKNTINSGLGTQEWKISTHTKTKCVNDTNCQGDHDIFLFDIFAWLDTIPFPPFLSCAGRCVILGALYGGLDPASPWRGSAPGVPNRPPFSWRKKVSEGVGFAWKLPVKG